MFLYLVPCLGNLQAPNTCLSLSWRLTNNGSSPATPPVKRKLLLGLVSVQITPLQPRQELCLILKPYSDWKLQASVICWCFLTQQQFFSKHIKLLMGILKVNLLFEVRRKEINSCYSISLIEEKFLLILEMGELSVMGVGKRFPRAHGNPAGESASCSHHPAMGEPCG